MRQLTARQAKLALALFDAGAFLTREQSPEGGGFRLKLHEERPDAALSPFYLNLRTKDHPAKPGPLTPELVREIGTQLYGLAMREQLRFDQIAGVPHAGTPLAQALAQASTGSPFPLIELAKSNGPGKREVVRISSSDFRQGQVVLLVDDLVTGAHSKLEAILVLERVGLEVRDVAVVVDRCQGGREGLKVAGRHLHSLLTVPEILDVLLEHRRISPGTYHVILDYLHFSI